MCMKEASLGVGMHNRVAQFIDLPLVDLVSQLSLAEKRVSSTVEESPLLLSFLFLHPNQSH